MQANASRPDHRWAGFTHAGLRHGSLRKIHAALKSWKQARTAAMVAKPALRWIGSLKKSRK